MRNVGKIAKEKLQGVRARRKLEAGFRLTRTEVDVIGILRDGLVQRRYGRIDQQVMMPRMLDLSPGRRNTPGSPQTEYYRYRTLDRGAIDRADEIGLAMGIGLRCDCEEGTGGDQGFQELQHEDGPLQLDLQSMLSKKPHPLGFARRSMSRVPQRTLPP